MGGSRFHITVAWLSLAAHLVQTSVLAAILEKAWTAWALLFRRVENSFTGAQSRKRRPVISPPFTPAICINIILPVLTLAQPDADAH